MPQNQPSPAVPDDLITCEDALLEEYAALFSDDWADERPPPRSGDWLRENAAWLHAVPKTALCLSGGGIRSAAFCLGALQALAKRNLLGEFNYLSTVSGGGYIGAWLETIMHDGGRYRGALRAANKALSDAEDPALRSLRNYTNFLVPEGGFGSSDTWSAIMLWLRNVLLNWLVFGPIMFALAVVPLFYRSLLWEVDPYWGWISLGAGLACLLGATIVVCRSVPTHAYNGGKDSKTGRYGVASWVVQLGVVVPVIAWAFLAPLWFISVATGRDDALPFWSWTFAPVSLGAFTMIVLGYFIAMFTLGPRHWPAFLWNAIFWIMGATLSALLLHVAATVGQQATVTTIAVLGPLCVIGAQLLQSTLYVGLRWTAAYAELDREWLARLSGEKLIPGLAWSALAAVTLVVPRLVFEQWSTTYAAIVGVASGPIGAWLGRSAQSFGAKSSATVTGAAWWASAAREALITLATLLFAATLFMLFGRLGMLIVEAIASEVWLDHRVPTALGLIVLLVAISFLAGLRVNINRFSLHGVYRNRLARAFIGTGRPPDERRPDAYTRFDPGDNLRMQDLYQGREHRGILFPVVNVTLNLMEGAPSGWAERKAAPFTITPLRAGAACLGKTTVGGDTPGCYVQTAAYGGQEHETGQEDEKSGITLGTAMTISGAAVSPNQGYHTSPATAFLMTLFNVRLGAWLPNPAVRQSWSQAKPSNALLPLFNEMFGRANDAQSDIYLSDGGHFDNLGVYEMLRRKCRRIVAIDAGCDPDYHYIDLGRALRMASIDLHVTVNFIAPVIKGDLNLSASGALASIRYHDGSEGLLLYLKPWRPRYLAPDVLAYWAEHSSFPHESTGDQFFEESQFESYRALGEQVASQAFARATEFPEGARLDPVFEGAAFLARASKARIN